MGATYTDTLPTDRDWVRRLTGDTNVTAPAGPAFQDEEIDAVLREEAAVINVLVPPGHVALKYLAASRIYDMLLTDYGLAGQGVQQKQVSKLNIRFGFDRGVTPLLQEMSKRWRMRAAYLLSVRPHAFRALP